MKKLALFLAFVLVLSIGLCACGGSGSNKHKILGVFLLEDELIIMDDFTNDATNRSLSSATLKIGPNTYSSNNRVNAGYFIHNFTHYYVPDGQSVPGGADTIRIAFCFRINSNDLSNSKATLSVFGENITVKLNNVQEINSVDDIYSVEDDPRTAQMVDSTCQMLKECHETLGACTGLGKGFYVTGSEFSFVNRRLSKFFNKAEFGGMSIEGEGGNDPTKILDPSLMSYDNDKVKAAYPELGAKLEEYISMLRELNNILDAPGNTSRASKLISDLRMKNATFGYMFDSLFHK